MRIICCSGHLSCYAHPSTAKHVPCHAHPPATCAPAIHAPRHTCPLPCMPPATHAPCHAHPCLPCTPPAMQSPSATLAPTMHAPLWTEFLTHACENITFPQFRLRTVINRWNRVFLALLIGNISNSKPLFNEDWYQTTTWTEPLNQSSTLGAISTEYISTLIC